MSQSSINERHRRSYSPKGLRVLRGPGDDYGAGSHWIVGDQYGYAEIRLMHDSKAYQPHTLYIENIVVKEPLRGSGYGRKLYQKIAVFARNIHAEYIQIDSEQEALGFWQKLGFKEIDAVYYHNKTAMGKEIKSAS